MKKKKKWCHCPKKKTSLMKIKMYATYAEKKFHSDENDKKYRKFKDHCHYTGKFRGAAHNNCNLRCKIPKEIPGAFHNGSTYDFHFIINQLAEEFEGKFECIGENMEKYITF